METAQLDGKPQSPLRAASKPEGESHAAQPHNTAIPDTLHDLVHPEKGWNSDEGVIWADDQGYIIYANPASERFLGSPPEELCGVFGFELCQPHSLPVAHEAFARCLANPGLPVDVTVDVARPSVGFRSLAVTLLNNLSVPDIRAIVVHFRDAAPPVLTEDGGG